MALVLSFQKSYCKHALLAKSSDADVVPDLETYPNQLTLQNLCTATLMLWNLLALNRMAPSSQSSPSLVQGSGQVWCQRLRLGISNCNL